MNHKRGHLRRLIARRWIACLKSPQAPVVLGDDHPLSRSVRRVHTLAVQAAATSLTVVVGGFALVASGSWAPRFLNAAVLVEATLLTILALTYQSHREHVLRLIADGGEYTPLEEVWLEVKRLERPRCARDLARQLERALEDAERSYQTPIASLQLEGVRLVPGVTMEVHEIVSCLRSEAAPPAGLARLTLMLRDADESALYGGDKNVLRQQLTDINQLLSVPLSSSAADRFRREEEPSWPPC